VRQAEPPLARAFGRAKIPKGGCFAAAGAVTNKRPSLVTVYHAADCGLCERALEIVNALHAEVDFDLQVIDIGGNAELEHRYRELLPVVEIDGEQAFTYFVDSGALRSRLEA